MKKLIMIFLLSAGLVVALPGTASANSATTTRVIGSAIAVNSSNQNYEVADADITVTCNGHTMTTKTKIEGNYKVVFSAADCPLWSTVTTVATKGNLSGTHSEPAIDFGTENIADIIVNMTPVAPVPEMGAVAALGAGVASVGAFVVARRRLNRGHAPIV